MSRQEDVRPVSTTVEPIFFHPLVVVGRYYVHSLLVASNGFPARVKMNLHSDLNTRQ